MTTMTTDSASSSTRRNAPRRGPHPVLHWLNELLHTEPFDFLFYGAFWTAILTVGSPLVGIFLIALTAAKFVLWVLNIRQNKRIKDEISSTDTELAVVVTGSDSGFGCDLTHALSSSSAREGGGVFVVFAGCLKEESMKQFEDNPRVISMKMDVTNDSEVEAAARKVQQWLVDRAAMNSRKERYLHAVVNNAGMGNGGLIDWLDLSVFQRNMDVNYYGMIRTTKAFYPIFKSQAAADTRTYPHARVVNMVSAAGLVTGGMAAPYHGSKFAAEAFSSCLRHEMNMFDVKVVTVNPTFHSTPLTRTMREVTTDMWNKLPQKTRDEYGQDFFDNFVKLGVDLPEQTEWRAKVVLEKLLESVELVHPNPQVVIGSDGKYGFLLNRHFPVWWQDMVQNFVLRHAQPKMLRPNI